MTVQQPVPARPDLTVLENILASLRGCLCILGNSPEKARTMPRTCVVHGGSVKDGSEEK